MIYLLLLTCILAVSAVNGDENKILPDESGRILKTGEVNNDAHEGMKMNIENDNMQTNHQYFYQKYNHEDHISPYIRKDKHDVDHDYHVNLHDHEDFHGPAIFRSINSNTMHKNQPDIARRNKIIADVYSPDYHQPIWVLDYRYMKTGGRDYTRGPGGQILILPKNVHTNEHKDFPDYDSLLEHLRLKNMAENNKFQHH